MSRETLFNPVVSLGGKDRLLAAATALALLFGAVFWMGTHRTASPRLHLLVGADISLSMGDEERRRACGVLEAVADGLPDPTPLDLWTYSREARKVFGAPVESAADLVEVEDRLVLESPPPTLPKTFIAPVLREMLSAAEKAQERGETVGLILLTDSEDWDPEATTAVVRKLAQILKLRAVWIVGADVESPLGLRSRVEKSFAPLGDRCIVSGPFDIKQGLEAFQARLQGGK
jgi:hypothetical protein